MAGAGRCSAVPVTRGTPDPRLRQGGGPDRGDPGDDWSADSPALCAVMKAGVGSVVPVWELPALEGRR